MTYDNFISDHSMTFDLEELRSNCMVMDCTGPQLKCNNAIIQH